jgi:hypothetical protein
MSNGNESNEGVTASSNSELAKRHPVFGALKGTTFVPPGVDLTEPADPDWANFIECRCPLRSRGR